MTNKTEQIRIKLFDLFENSGWSGVLNTLGQRSKEEVIGVILNDVEDLLSEQRQSILEEVEKEIKDMILPKSPNSDWTKGYNQSLADVVDTVIKIINK